MKYEAANNFVWVVRDETETEIHGFLIPDSAKVKPNKGTIVSIGSLVTDKKAKVGRKAIFNKSVGQDLELDGVKYTILRSEDQIFGYESSE